jgi:hypothetical protein
MDHQHIHHCHCQHTHRHTSMWTISPWVIWFTIGSMVLGYGLLIAFL